MIHAMSALIVLTWPLFDNHFPELHFQTWNGVKPDY
jgi:hypothetical protein